MTIAVRRHYKYTVKDEFGNAISNALVFFYQPGTTTNFTGTAYTTLAGGTTASNPFTTNSQGDAEAWFDTPQAVDVLITDNTDQALRAGSSTQISFSSFTEFGVIGTGIEATAGNLSTIDVGDAASAGTSAFAAAADHQHGISTVTKSFLLTAEDATLGAGSAFLTTGSGLNQARTVEYSDAASEDAFWTFLVPDDYVSGNINVAPYWSPATTDGTPHTVRWVYTSKQLTTGVSVIAAGTTVTWTGASAARTVDVMVADTSTSTNHTPSGAGVLYSINVQRLGSDGADTYVGAVRLHGLLVSYTGYVR